MSLPEYELWRKNPTSKNLNAVLNALMPTINSELQRFNGPPHVLKAKAKLLAINAIKTYNPKSGAHLRSWVVTQLQPLSRYSQKLKPVYVPELAARQAAELNTARQRLSDELGREPTDEELADELGLSVNKIKKLKSAVPAVMSESSIVDMNVSDDFSSGNLPAVVSPNTLDLAQSIVYESLDPNSKKLYDLKTKPQNGKYLSNKEIASLLNISPARVSQRTKEIAEEINNLISKGWV